MKKLVFPALLFLLIILSPSLFGQDYILKIFNEVQSIHSQELKVTDDYVIFKSQNTDAFDSIPFHHINELRFEENGNYEIISFRWALDTIACSIDSIGSHEVYFTLNGNANKTLSKSEIFFIAFGSTTTQPKVDEYWSKISNHPQLTEGTKITQLIKKNGESYEVIDLLGIDDNYVNFKTTLNGNEIETKTRIEQLDKYVHQEIKSGPFYRIDDQHSYMLANDGSVSQVMVNDIRENKIQLRKIQDGEENNLNLSDNEVAGLFFNRFESTKEVVIIDKTEKETRKLIDFNINPFYGHMIGKSLADSLLPFSSDELEDELRGSFGINLNVNVFFVDQHGVGITYKFFRTSGSSEVETFEIPGGLFVNSMASEQQLSYYGFNYIFSEKISELFIVDFIAGAGIVDFSMEEIYNNSYSINATSRATALNLATRWTLARKGYYGIYLELSLLYGRLSELELESQDFTFENNTVKLGNEDPSDFSRIEIGMGVKF